jgi:hypothetical protein
MAEDKQHHLKSVTFEIPSSTPEEEEEQRQRFFKFLEDDSTQWKDWLPRERGIARITRPGKYVEIEMKKQRSLEDRNDDGTETTYTADDTQRRSFGIPRMTGVDDTEEKK